MVSTLPSTPSLYPSADTMESAARARILKRPRQAGLAPFCQRKYFKKTAKGKVLKGASSPPADSSPQARILA